MGWGSHVECGKYLFSLFLYKCKNERRNIDKIKGKMMLNNRKRNIEAGGDAVEEDGRGGYTQDGTVDLRGNPVLRSKRGAWTACSFIVGT